MLNSSLLPLSRVVCESILYIGLLFTFLLNHSTAHSDTMPVKDSVDEDHSLLIEKVNQIIDQKIQACDSEKCNITGATIAIQFKGKSLLTRSIGYADEAQLIPVNKHTGFRIASISKLFAALSIMKLSDQGLLSLDDSIFSYLPDYNPRVLPGVNPDNRIRDLLTHHNGIPSIWLKGFETDKSPLDSLRDLPADLSNDFLVENRREVHAYTNAAFALLGLIVENVSGMPYDEFLILHFFEKYNMTDAHTFLRKNLQNIALPHVAHQPYPPKPIQMVPAGSVIASATDMNKFSQLLIDTWHGKNTDLIKYQSLREMSKYQHKNVIYDVREFMGLGFYVDNSRGHKSIGHGGDLESYASSLKVIPSLQLGVFVSSNGQESTGFPKKLVASILDEIVGVRKSNIHQEPVTSMADELPYTGAFFQQSDNDVLEFMQDANGAYLISSGQKFNLKSISHDVWQVVEAPSYTIKKGGNFAGYSLHEDGKEKGTLLTRFTRQSRSNIWDAFVGKSFLTTSLRSGIISITLQYDSEVSSYYIVYSVNNDDDPGHLYVKPVTDNLLQVLGKGRERGVVFEYLDDDTVSFAGLKFEQALSANAAASKIADKK